SDDSGDQHLFVVAQQKSPPGRIAITTDLSNGKSKEFHSVNFGEGAWLSSNEKGDSFYQLWSGANGGSELLKGVLKSSVPNFVHHATLCNENQGKVEMLKNGQCSKSPAWASSVKSGFLDSNK